MASEDAVILNISYIHMHTAREIRRETLAEAAACSSGMRDAKPPN